MLAQEHAEDVLKEQGLLPTGGVLSILAPTTLATRPDLIDSIERQLSRPLGPEVNLANAYLDVARTRDQDVETYY